MQLQAKYGDKARSDSEAAASSARIALLSAMVVTFLVALALGIFLALSVSRPLEVMVREARRLCAAVGEGKIDVRSDASQVADEFRPVIAGLNETMAAFEKPIRMTAEYVDRISRGDLPPKVTDAYQGDFNLIKQNLNNCIDAVQALIADAAMLSKAAVEGKLATRADASKHQGDFRKVVQGVNDTLDAVIGPLGVAAM